MPSHFETREDKYVNDRPFGTYFFFVSVSYTSIDMLFFFFAKPIYSVYVCNEMQPSKKRGKTKEITTLYNLRYCLNKSKN